MARQLLHALLTSQHLPSAPILLDANARPFMPELPQLDFNFSHTAGLAVCAAVISHSCPPRVGVDVERTDAVRDASKMASRFFAPFELAYFENMGKSNQAFITVWTRKEAYAKYRGDGLAKHLSQSDTMAPSFEKEQGVKFHTPTSPHPFVITVCAAPHEGPLRIYDVG